MWICQNLRQTMQMGHPLPWEPRPLRSVFKICSTLPRFKLSKQHLRIRNGSGSSFLGDIAQGRELRTHDQRTLWHVPYGHLPSKREQNRNTNTRPSGDAAPDEFTAGNKKVEVRNMNVHEDKTDCDVPLEGRVWSKWYQLHFLGW